MVKPIQEQEWTYRGLSGDVVGEDGHALTADGVPDEALRAIAALPTLLSAVLDVTPIVNGVAHSPLCGVHGLGTDKRCHYTCETIGAALRKAGVL